MKYIKTFESQFINNGYIVDLTKLLENERLERQFFKDLENNKIPWDMIGSSMSEIKIPPLTEEENIKLNELFNKYHELTYRERKS